MLKYQPRSMLVTGGAGFIGSNFIRMALRALPDVTIINLDKLTYAGSLKNLVNFPSPKRHHFIQGDINDTKLIRHILQHHHVDTIVHFAAESHVDRSIAEPAAFVETNVSGTFNLLESARYHWFEVEECLPEHCRFHHVSTDEVYGSLNANDAAFTEKTNYSPRSPYSASKAASDHFALAYFHTYGLPVTISHCSNNYGPYQHAEKFIPTVIRSCLKNEAIPIYGNGKNIRDWLYVDDHCRGILSILNHGKVGESYNMGGNHEMGNLDLARQICLTLDALLPRENSYQELLKFVTDRQGHDFRYAMDNTKIARELAWQPSENFASGLRKTIDFYRQ